MSTSAISETSNSMLATYTETSSGNNTLGEADFLTLLVAQLEHQDPLEPQDNTEFVAQLAQFSSLEEQTATNNKLDELIAAQGSSEQTAAFSLLGQEVIAASDSLYLQGDDIELGFSLNQSATNANITIKDEDGNSVANFSLSDPEDGYNFVHWDGTDSSGSPLPKGVYNMEIEVTDASGQAVESQSLVKVRVDEVSLDSSGSILVTDAGNLPLNGVSSVVAQ
jgi:flagellar basal-body rod modification protein FlgD